MKLIEMTLFVFPIQLVYNSMLVIVMFHVRGLQTLYVMCQIVNIFSFVTHTSFLAITHLCHCNKEAAMDGM